MRHLSVIIPTFNEEKNLGQCLSSLESLNADIFIVDSGSRDGTIGIAEKFGVKVVSHPFENHAKQYNWAIEHLPITTPWTMRMDADERLTRGCLEEIIVLLTDISEDYTAISIKRRVYFWGRWIRHGGYYPTHLTRFWRTGQARCEDRWMDEHMVISGRGKLYELKNDLIDENRKGLSFWIEKHNQYADREVIDLITNEQAKIKGSDGGYKLSREASKKRWLKTNLYWKSPLFLRAFLYWCYRYFLLLGFLDGIPGMVFHFLQGGWYRFLIDAKYFEYKWTLEKHDKKE